MNKDSIDYSHWLTNLDEWSFDQLATAAESVALIHQALANDELSIVSEWLRDKADKPIQAWAHYPEDDCRDPETGAMVYYHAHDPAEWDRDEHGHFHLFVRPAPEQAFTHVAALSMSAYGMPVALFATNGWVTDEQMLPAEEVLRLLDEGCWQINRARPSWQVLQWLDALLTLSRPYIEELLLKRDQLVGWTQQGQSSTGILDDRDTHILSELPLDWPGILESVQSEARMRMNPDTQGAAVCC
jgi:hypothetical protein